MNNKKQYLKFIENFKTNKPHVELANTRPPRLIANIKGLQLVYMNRPANTDQENKNAAELRKEIMMLNSDGVFIVTSPFLYNKLHWFKPFTYHTYNAINKQINKEQRDNK